MKEDLIQVFVTDNRWQLLLSGLGATILITIVAAILGIILGVVTGIVRSAWDKNRERMERNRTAGYWILRILNRIAVIYITIIRGTPTVVQLMLCYFAIFASARNGLMLAFGLNSGAYVAEIIRGGIMSMDDGQFEAGRSLGFNYPQTMRYVIIPQVVKAVLPALMNEFITLFKETSIAGYVGIRDLTKAGDIIRAATYLALPPLLATAAIYLAIVMLLTAVETRFERSLRKNEL